MSTTISDTILSMARRTTGVRADEVHGLTIRQVFNAITKLHAAGKLFRAKVSHKNVRFFAYESMRDQFLEQVKLAAYQAKREAMFHAQDGKAPWAADAPAVTPDHVQIQYCPAYEPRFREHVLPFVHGGLRCA